MLWLLLCAVSGGCSFQGRIDIDLATEPPRFHIDHKGWPRPFYCPRVTEFAIASEEDGPIWQLESSSSRGEEARELTIVYGVLPRGFVQVLPEGDKSPIALRVGRNYFVAAGGPRALYRMVFALPVESWRPILPAPAQNEPILPDELVIPQEGATTRPGER